MNLIHIQHLYNRIGFGITPKELKKLSKQSRETVVKNLFKGSKKNTPVTVDLPFLETITPKQLKDKSLRQEIRKKSREKTQEFAEAWYNRLTNPTELLREKMTLFWANHFVCQSNNILFIQQYNNALRKHALGDFKLFTKAVSKEAAMLIYLNNKQNRKQSPNENFARELMELFTLGENHYTQNDIKEAARAFTGYNHNFKGDFKFRKNQHDFDNKSFFNKNGNFMGDDIIDIILEQKQCAQFISEKIYRYFVNDRIDTNHIAEMTAVFYKNYNIENLMKYVFLSDWFYDTKNIGCKIKSPIEFLVGIHTTVPFTFQKTRQLFLVQRLLGQILMKPPNVAGWKTGKYWIDSNTLVTRLRLPSVLLNNAVITFSEKGDEEDVTNVEKKKLRRSAYIKTVTNWNTFETSYEGISNTTLITNLISSPISEGTKTMLLAKVHLPKKDFCIQLMSIPEYQLC